MSMSSGTRVMNQQKAILHKSSSHVDASLRLGPTNLGCKAPQVEQATSLALNEATGEFEQRPVTIRIAPEPSARGAMRTMHRMWELDPRSGMIVAELAAKFIDGQALAEYGYPTVTRQMYLDDIRLQHAAADYARRYNALLPPKPVQFVSARLLVLHEREGDPVCFVEPLLTGAFEKHNTNLGHVCSARDTPQAFSHFSYERSGHREVVVDVQGVEDIYTDPQIHSLDQSHGLGNLGQDGIDKFVASHRCNNLCKLLDLPPLRHDDSDLSDAATRTFAPASTADPVVGNVAFDAPEPASPAQQGPASPAPNHTGNVVMESPRFTDTPPRPPRRVSGRLDSCRPTPVSPPAGASALPPRTPPPPRRGSMDLTPRGVPVPRPRASPASPPPPPHRNGMRARSMSMDDMRPPAPPSAHYSPPASARYRSHTHNTPFSDATPPSPPVWADPLSQAGTPYASYDHCSPWDASPRRNSIDSTRSSAGTPTLHGGNLYHKPPQYEHYGWQNGVLYM